MRRRGKHCHGNAPAHAVKRRVAARHLKIHRAVRFGMALPGIAFGHAQGFAQYVSEAGPLTQLCLQQVHEATLPDFEPVGSSVDDVSGSDPAITMWSQTSLLVVRVSAAGPIATSTYRTELSEVHPFAAALTGWRGDTPAVELFDTVAGTVWEMELAPSEATTTRTHRRQRVTSIEAVPVSGIMRSETGWVRAQRITDPLADTSAIIFLGSNSVGPSRDPAPSVPVSEVANGPARRIDRILHMRPGGGNGALVTEAAFPFTTVEFTSGGAEAWRAAPAPDELRDQLGETDLRYVIATPAIKVGPAVLNTLVALRSGRRVSALWMPDAASPRYREVPGDFSFLGAFPSHRLLVATRSGRPYRLILFRWHWTDQGQSCTHAPT